MQEAAFGSVEVFFRGLEVIGVPHPRTLEEARREFTEKEDSHDAFKSWNSGPIETTPNKEWDFVFEPFEPDSVSKASPPSAWQCKHDYGGGRWPMRRQVLSHAVGAKAGKTIFFNFREAHTLDQSDPQWLHKEEVSHVPEAQPTPRAPVYKLLQRRPCLSTPARCVSTLFAADGVEMRGAALM